MNLGDKKKILIIDCRSLYYGRVIDLECCRCFSTDELWWSWWSKRRDGPSYFLRYSYQEELEKFNYIDITNDEEKYKKLCLFL